MVNRQVTDPNFKSYPHRGFSCSDEVWEELKNAKTKSGKTWTNFIKDLLNKK